MGKFLILLWAVTCGYSFLSNRDIFSPVKLYLLTLGVYFSDLFVHEYFTEIYLTYILYVLMGFALAMLEAKYKAKASSVPESPKLLANSHLIRITILLWLLTAIPLAAQLYLISYMGGFEQYLAKLGFRVLEWQGLGHVTTGIKFINIITIFYFGAGLVAKLKRPKLWWALFGLHFLIFLSMGLLSGSRGFLEIIITMLILYHYLRRSITIKAAVSIGLVLFLAATAIGIARNGFKVDEGKIKTGFNYGDSDRLKLRQGDYGIQPLDLVYSQELQELQFGKTFLTIITNFVPRTLWPGKPDSGGLVLTKQFTGDAWDGASNLSTGMIAESIINFGYVSGVIIGSVLLFGSMFLIIKSYFRIRSAPLGQNAMKAVLMMLLYTYTMKTVVGLVLTEFTNAMMPLLINGISLVAVYVILEYKVTLFHAMGRVEAGAIK